MTIESNKLEVLNINHYINYNDVEYEVGVSQVMTANGYTTVRESFYNNAEFDSGVFIELMARVVVPADTCIYMYKYYDLTYEPCYFMVNHKRLHTNGEYVEKIVYTDEMESDNDLDALREFAIDLKHYMD